MISSTPQNRMSFGAKPSDAFAGSVRPSCLGAAVKAVLATAVLSTLSACAGRSDLGFATLMSEVPATRAIIVPPPGGPSVVAVLQRSYQDGLSQEIALSTASLTTGQNAFYVSMLNNTQANPEQSETLSLPSLSQDRLLSEMEERMPGVEMQTSLVYVQNKFGPFGFATGRSSSGDLCLYAWQRIEPDEPAVFLPGGSVSVRLRLCDADATVEQLLQSLLRLHHRRLLPPGILESLWRSAAAAGPARRDERTDVSAGPRQRHDNRPPPERFRGDPPRRSGSAKAHDRQGLRDAGDPRALPAAADGTRERISRRAASSEPVIVPHGENVIKLQ